MLSCTKPVLAGKRRKRGFHPQAFQKTKVFFMEEGGGMVRFGTGLTTHKRLKIPSASDTEMSVAQKIGAIIRGN